MPQFDDPIADQSDANQETWRSSLIPPVLGQWYSSPARRQPFQVISVTDESAQLRFLDDHAERVWLDEWSELDAEFTVFRTRVPSRNGFAKRSYD